jgi:hypothetical protein
MFSVLEAPFVNVPAPLSPVVTVRVALFVTVPVTATVGMEVVVDPLIVFDVPENV